MKSMIYNNMDMYIYFESDDKKEEVLDELLSNNKIKYDSYDPVVIYLDDFGLPNKKIKEDISKITLNTICKEYLYFNIAIKLIEKLKQDIEIDMLPRKDVILNKIKRQFLVSDKYDIKTCDELLETLNESKNYYKEQYFSYTDTGNFNRDLKNIKIPYLDIEDFVNYFKKLISNNSYICILIDNKEDVNITSKKCVNALVDINYEVPFTIKVLTSVDDWKNFDDLYGHYIEPTCSVYDNNLVKKLSK